MDEFEKQEIQQRARAEQFRNSAPEKFGLTPKVVDIFSDGTRMSGTFWRSKNIPEDKKLPAILLCGGFGSKRSQLDFSYASRFAQAGFAVLTFDYRGWGDSDGILLAAEKQPSPDASGIVSIKARIVRRIVDSEWQLRDVDSAWNFLLSEPSVDATRCGIWGSSYGGGHALTMAGRDPRVKCVVIQIAAVNAHANWINRHPQYRGEAAIRDLAAKHARGLVYPWHLSKPKGLDGMPNLPKTVFEHTRTVIDATREIKSPVMLLAAEKEETFHNSKNSDLIYNMLKEKVPVDFDYLPGTHYDAYDKAAYTKGVAKALDWFRIYLGDHDMLAKVEMEKAAAAAKAKEAAAAAKSEPKVASAKL